MLPDLSWLQQDVAEPPAPLDTVSCWSEVSTNTGSHASTTCSTQIPAYARQAGQRLLLWHVAQDVCEQLVRQAVQARHATRWPFDRLNWRSARSALCAQALSAPSAQCASTGALECWLGLDDSRTSPARLEPGRSLSFECTGLMLPWFWVGLPSTVLVCALDRSKQLCDLLMCQRIFLHAPDAAPQQCRPPEATCICMRSQCKPIMRLDERQLECLRRWVEHSLGR